MEIYVGTSGWMYSWNLGKSLQWYVEKSGLNTVELNSSFYRFPYKNQVRSWRERGKDLRWSIKVHRSISHVHRLDKNSYEIWYKFLDAFKSMDDIVYFYLIQLPPSFKKNEENVERIVEFSRLSALGERLAIELRHKSWFDQDTVDLFKKLGITIVSISSPIGEFIARSNDIVYMRMHGTERWYYYEYKDSELSRIAKEIVNKGPKKVYVYFNNDLWMLSNGLYMLKLLKEFNEG
ncbi:MAG: DUF72 domain-containing protein [Caldisphaeraceae archaeon]|nr:DUF72 domain-containing protein [Caldisphaeraceae archaeon]MEB3691750.1 DUF72 domain-containing protein [Caldisphaeraceae archaeon]MEB3797807.1 DUF72 domain-containing protein [Caldisphaeraceae archaeon]